MRCILCRNNIAGPGVYLAPDAPELAGVVMDGVPVSADYLTPPERARLEAANVTAKAFEDLGKPREQAPLATEERTCPSCGAAMALRSGTAKKNGRPWTAWMCAARCGQTPQWVAERKVS